MKKQIILAVLAAVGLTFAQEQKTVSFGIRAGLNLASLGIGEDRKGYYDDSSYSETSNITIGTGNLIGFSVSAVADIQLIEFLYFQPGLMFSRKGGSMENEYEEVERGNTEKEKEETTVASYYIDLPLNFSLKGNLANELALRAHFGPYIGFGLFGEMESKSKRSYEDTERNYSKKMKLFSKEKDCDEDYDDEVCSEYTMFSRFNFGIDFGVGIEYSNLYLGVSYNYGLTNLASKDREDKDKIYERTLGIMLGYNF
jgi:hypothetical protein